MEASYPGRVASGSPCRWEWAFGGCGAGLGLHQLCWGSGGVLGESLRGVGGRVRGRAGAWTWEVVPTFTQEPPFLVTCVVLSTSLGMPDTEGLPAG